MATNNIRQARRDKNLTQSELAKKIGLTTSAISNYETGVSAPSIEIVKAIAAALGTTVEYLINGEGLPSDASPPAEEHAMIRIIDKQQDMIKAQQDMMKSQQETIAALVGVVSKTNPS